MSEARELRDLAALVVARKWRYDNPDHCGGVQSLAQYVLSSIPEDADEPTDEAFLLACGGEQRGREIRFVLSGADEFRKRTLAVDVTTSPPRAYLDQRRFPDYSESIPLGDVPTRGKFRLICSALGITQ